MSTSTKTIKLSQKQWETIGKQAGWMKTAGITEEQWALFDDFKKRTVARNNLSKLISRRIGIGLDDLPDTPEIQIDQWWDSGMTLQETVSAIKEAYEEIMSSFESEGMGSMFI